MKITETNQAESGNRSLERPFSEVEKIRALSDEMLDWVAGGENPPPLCQYLNTNTNAYTHALRKG